ncbi:hypothetical protein RGZ1_151 [Morganella phage vB_MmoM_Rgz1]|nr:hypothetical protein RGZ1_151 [Morganella phage vB_MmoM_Rgz1]
MKLTKMIIKPKKRKLGYYALLKSKVKCKPKYVYVTVKWNSEIIWNTPIFYCPDIIDVL